MKALKKLLVNILAVAMLFVASVSLIGCSSKTVTVELELAIYNNAEHEYYEDTTLTITLEREYAPETVDAIVSYLEEGYYNDAIFYGVDSDKIMVGDLKMDANGKIVQNTVKPTLKPEFERGAVSGSDLKLEKGSIGLFRTWYERDGYSVSNSLDTGRATWLMPTSALTDYDDWFCVFATIDLDDDTNKQTIDYLKDAIKNDAETYEIYYTGEYDATKDDENNGLTFHCEEEVDDGVKVFEPKGEQYYCYAQQQIKVVKGAGNICGARIVSATVI